VPSLLSSLLSQTIAADEVDVDALIRDDAL
jgi:hypothetical protein